MEKVFKIHENGIHMVWKIREDGGVRLLHFSALPFDEKTIKNDYEENGCRLVELEAAGYDRPEERHGTKYIVTAPGYRMKYLSHKDERNETGRKLEICTGDEESGLQAINHFQFFDGIAMVRCWCEVKNTGTETQTLEYVSTFNLNGVEKEGVLTPDEKIRIGVVHNAWQKELQVKEYSLPDAGMEFAQFKAPVRSSKAFEITNTGNWSAKSYIPMGYVANTETGSRLFWQIEHNGSWHWEVSDFTNHLYVQLSGPTEQQSHWFKDLKPGDTFTTVPAGVGAVTGELGEMAKELTKYRRAIRRKNQDNEKLGVIFNDYMNCLWADPTTEKEIPLIDAAAKAGCEYFCIDAGWYADGFWWDAVGEWKPSQKRFPNGIKEVIDYIRSKGMIPGLWLELEVMGIKSPMVEKMPEKAFFQRHGKRIYDRSRYQLDFRQPEVIAHANEVIDRLVREYGIGYIKMDYNIEPGIGTEVDASCPGEGLLGHERAYLAWLDSVFQRYPDLIIENCSSGGLRMDYAMLSRYSIQSTSDQEDYRYYATISANAPLAVAMEQAAVWSYPKAGASEEETIFNMVNAILLRIHQSGHLAKITDVQKDLVKEALDYYKTIRGDIRQAYPYWPIGTSGYSDDWSALALDAGKKHYVAVWRRGGKDRISLPMTRLAGKEVKVRCAYPQNRPVIFGWNAAESSLSVRMEEEICARLFEIEVVEDTQK